jgi:hypothetical protein
MAMPHHYGARRTRCAFSYASRDKTIWQGRETFIREGVADLAIHDPESANLIGESGRREVVAGFAATAAFLFIRFFRY